MAEVLDLLALWRVAHAFPADLDPLTLQRAALARAIVGDPALLLMDDRSSATYRSESGARHAPSSRRCAVSSASQPSSRPVSSRRPTRSLTASRCSMMAAILQVAAPRRC